MKCSLEIENSQTVENIHKKRVAKRVYILFCDFPRFFTFSSFIVRAAPAFNFGGAAPTTATNSNPFQFGQTNQTQQSAPSSNSTPFQFGASSTTQNTDNSTPFQFGGAPQTAPVTQNVNPFGAQSSGMGNMQQQQQAAPSFNFNSTAPQQNTGFNQAAAPEQTGGDNPFAFGQSNQAAAPGGGRKIAKATRRRKR